MNLAELSKWWQEAQQSAVPQQGARAVLDYVTQEGEADLDALREVLTDHGVSPALHLGILSSMVDQGYLTEQDGDHGLSYTPGAANQGDGGAGRPFAEDFHGPEPPGPGWTQVGEGPRGGKVWRKERQGQPAARPGLLGRMARGLRGLLGQGGRAAVHVAPEVAGEVTSLFGSPQGVAAAVGAGGQKGVKVAVKRSRYSDALQLDVEGPGWHAQRYVSRGEDGRPVMRNESITVTEKGKGTGTRLFAAQVADLARRGFSHIETTAEGSKKDPLGRNGYYTWARLGYDGPIPAATRSKLPEGLADATSVQDLLARPGGLAAWKEHGQTFNGAFDLDPQSRSSRVLAAYLGSLGPTRHAEAHPHSEGAPVPFAEEGPLAGPPATRHTDAAFSDDEMLQMFSSYWTPCRSSHVAQARYHAEDERLEVEFLDGTRGHYPSISADLAEDFGNAPSKGGWIADYMVPSKWPFIRD